jgi:hypothetical protein
MKRIVVLALLLVSCGDSRLSPQGGSITSVQGGNGLTGGGTGGAVTLNIVGATGGGLTVGANDVGLLSTCTEGQVLKWDDTANEWECGVGGISNSAGANVIPKSDGTNLVASQITDDGTTVTVDGPTVIKTGNPTAVGALLAGTTLSLTTVDGTFNRLAFHSTAGKSIDFYNSSASPDGTITYDGGSTLRGFLFGTAGTNRVWLDSSGTLRLGDDPSGNIAIASDVDVLSVANTGTGQTADAKAGIRVDNSGTYTTAVDGTITTYGIHTAMTSTDAGVGTLVNVALRATASGGDQNWAAQFSGDIGFAPTTTIKPTGGGAGALAINVGGSTLTFCSDSACAVSISGASTFTTGTGLTTASGALTVAGATILGDTNADSTQTFGLVRHRYDATHYLDIDPKSNHDVSLITSTSGGNIYFAAYNAAQSTIIGASGNIVVNSTAASSITGAGGFSVTANLTVNGDSALGNANTDNIVLTGNTRQGGDDTHFAWDSGGSLRVGFTKKAGDVGKLTFGSANSLEIAQSSGVGIEATNTFTTKVTISSTGLAVTGNLSASATTTVADFRGTVITPNPVNGIQHNWAPTGHATATFVHVTPDGTIDLTGFSGGATGRVITIRNEGGPGYPIVLYHENASSTAANRFDLSGDTAWALTTGDSVTFTHDGSRWVQTGFAGRRYPGMTLTGNLDLSGVAGITGATTGSFSGNVTLGDAGGDVHTVNGSMTITNGLNVSSSGITVTGSGLNVQGGTAQFDQNVVVGNANTDTLTINSKIDSHVYYTGTAPALSSCGTGATINGNDRVGTVTGGTGSPTGCTLTFASAYSTNAPVCVITPLADPGTSRIWISAVSTTVLTISFNVAANSFPWAYHCSGRL